MLGSQLLSAINDSQELPALGATLEDAVNKTGRETVILLCNGTPPTYPPPLIGIEFPGDHSQAISTLKECSQSVCITQLYATADRTALLVRFCRCDAGDNIDLRIAVVGNVDAGKSTLLGVLTRGLLDDGRGYARTSLFRHKHEAETGRTSSIGNEIMGLGANGEPVIGMGKAPERPMSWSDICERAAKIVSFIDLAGHERYFKTTVSGMTGCLPDYVMLVVSANSGLVGMTKEHLGIALALAIPVIVVVTKVDMTPQHVYETTLSQLTRVLQSPGCKWRTNKVVRHRYLYAQMLIQLMQRCDCNLSGSARLYR